MSVISIIGVILKAAELAKLIKKVKDEVIPPPPEELKDKHRWYQCTIKNETQFPLLFGDVYWWKHRGRWWTAPGDTQKFEQLVFSACNKDHEPTGVTGGIAVRLKLDEKNFFDIAIGLTAPDGGGYKAGAVESSDPKAGYDIATDNGNHITSQNQYKAVDGDDPDKEINIEFHVSAQPANEMLIVITQVRL